MHNSPCDTDTTPTKRSQQGGGGPNYTATPDPRSSFFGKSLTGGSEDQGNGPYNNPYII